MGVPNFDHWGQKQLGIGVLSNHNYNSLDQEINPKLQQQSNFEHKNYAALSASLVYIAASTVDS